MNSIFCNTFFTPSSETIKKKFEHNIKKIKNYSGDLLKLFASLYLRVQAYFQSTQ